MSQREEPRHNLRLPPELQKKLKHSAIDNGCSMNAELLVRLTKSFDPDPAELIASALAPIGSLTDEERKQVADMLVSAGTILGKTNQPK